MQAGFYFRQWEYNLGDAQKPLALTLGLIAFFSMVYIAYILYTKYFVRDPGPFVTENLADLENIFEQSIAERATYEVQFEGEGEQRAHFTCSPVQRDPAKGVVLEVSSYIHPRPEWIGRPVFSFFKVSSGRNGQKWTFYQFKSSITDIRRSDKLEYIVVAIPEQLKREQRRQHLRLDPLPEDIPQVSIWPETLGNLDQPPQGPAMLSFMLGSPGNQIQVLDISAGGMFFEVRSTVLSEASHDLLEKGKRLFIQLTLRDPDTQFFQHFMTVAQVRKAFPDHQSGTLRIGVSFSTYRPLIGPEEEIPWIPLKGEGIEEIEDWVFKRHLQLYREKGIV